jgi:hypothetical protein
MEYTKLTLTKEVNRKLNTICAKLEMPKTKFLERIAKAPLRSIEALIEEKSDENNL